MSEDNENIQVGRIVFGDPISEVNGEWSLFPPYRASVPATTDNLTFTILPQSAINAMNQRLAYLEAQLDDISNFVHDDHSGPSVDEILGALSLMVEDKYEDDTE